METLILQVKAAVHTKLKLQAFCGLADNVEDRVKKDTKRALLHQCLETLGNFLKYKSGVEKMCLEMETKLSSLSLAEKRYFELNHKVVGSLIDSTEIADAIKVILTECQKKLDASSELVTSLVGDCLTNSWHDQVERPDEFKSVSAAAADTIGKIRAKPLSSAIDTLDKDHSAGWTLCCRVVSINYSNVTSNW